MDKKLLPKPLPHSDELERQVIGTMLLDRNAIPKVIEILPADAFYNQKHSDIYRAIRDMFGRGENVDLMTLTEELKRLECFDKIGGAGYLVNIGAGLSTTANVVQHSLIVKEKYLRRQLHETGLSIIQKAGDDTNDILDEIDWAEQLIFSLANKRIQTSYSKIDKIVGESLCLIEMLTTRTDELVGVPSGLADLDRYTCGFQNSDLIIIAGRPSMGKTALGLCLARYAAVECRIPVAFFSIEMTAVQLGLRLISQEAQVDHQNIRRGKLNYSEFERVKEAVGIISKAPLVIDDCPSLGITELRAKCRRIVSEHGAKMIIVDYLQLIASAKREQNRDREIAVITSSLKQIAKEMNIPVVVLAQLNRSVEARSDKRPILSDLRESGSIEQDADVVIFVNRLEVYKKMTYEDGNPTENTAELILAKQRNGPTGTVRVQFQKEYALFRNLAYEQGTAGGYSYEDPPEDNEGF